MTKKEAILILRNNKPTTDTRLCGKELCEAVDMAIDVLERMTKADSDGCKDCAFANFEKWEMPCFRCRWYCEDYWRKGNDN